MLLNYGAGEDSCPWDCKEIQPVHPKGNQLWIFIRMIDAEAEAPTHLIGRTDSLKKTLRLGKIEGREKGTTEDEMVGCHHWLNGHEFEQTPGDSKMAGKSSVL